MRDWSISASVSHSLTHSLPYPRGARHELNLVLPQARAQYLASSTRLWEPLLLRVCVFMTGHALQIVRGSCLTQTVACVIEASNSYSELYASYCCFRSD